MSNRSKQSELFNGKSLWMPDMVEQGLRRGGDGVFVFFRRADGITETVRYSDVLREGESLRRRLKLAGVRRGDRIGVVCAMRAWWYSLLYAALKDGYRMVCIDPGISREQVTSMLDRTDIRAAVTTLRELVLPDELAGRIPVFELSEGFPSMNGCDSVDTNLEDAPELPEETFFILFSSGTTGERRKGVLLPHTTVSLAIEYGMSTDSGVYKNRSSYSVRDRDLMMFPPYHIAGLLCATMDVYCNTQVILLEKMTGSALAGVLQELKPDNICTVPSVLTALMKKIRAGIPGGIAGGLIRGLFSFSGWCRKKLGWNVGRRLLGFLNRKAFGGRMDGFMIGGSACDADTMRFYLSMGIDVSLAYGLTELGAPLAVTGPGFYPGTTGRALRHTDALDIRVVNPDENGRGEVEVLSPYRMITYLDQEDNNGVWTDDGYFRTGDLGYIDDEQCLVICGRAKECIVLRNGEKLLPEEIEARYTDMKDISELVAFRVPDGNCDAFSIAVISSRPELPNELIRLHVLDRAATLPGTFSPREVYVLHSLPLSSSHKVQRFRLTEMAVSGASTANTEEDMEPVDEDDTTAALRRLLVESGGSLWKTAELTHGTMLNLDSLQTMELFAAIEEAFGCDLFLLASQPETFGELREAVVNFATAEKTSRIAPDLSAWPAKISSFGRAMNRFVKFFIRNWYHVHGVGTENIPRGEAMIFCSNHQTAADPLFILSSLNNELGDSLTIVGKVEVTEMPVFKQLTRCQPFVPVNRTGNTKPTLMRCGELLQDGMSVLIFPEGTNYENSNGTMLSFKEGPARMAIDAGVRMIPVQIKGAGRIDSNVESLVPPRTDRVDVVFGKPVETSGLTVEEVNRNLRAAMEAL